MGVVFSIDGSSSELQLELFLSCIYLRLSCREWLNLTFDIFVRLCPDINFSRWLAFLWAMKEREVFCWTQTSLNTWANPYFVLCCANKKWNSNIVFIPDANVSYGFSICRQWHTKCQKIRIKRVNELLDICCYSPLFGSTAKIELGRWSTTGKMPKHR